MGPETIAAIVAVFSALGVKEWWAGRAATKNGMAQLEREQIRSIVQNSKDAEDRVNQMEKAFDAYKIEAEEKISELKKTIFELQETVAKLRVLLVRNGIEPEMES